MGLTHTGISKIETGHRTPEIKTVLKIKIALGKPLDWIYFGDEPIVLKKNRLRANAMHLHLHPRESQDYKACFTQLFTIFWWVWWGRG
ncbi:helix-turn-helix transcriptional regulator [Candidatus Liberibacter solanacearum]|uniref:helix-turn-helix transcriptional regulator n=1 Tax=Candidatus Liberibacter solanacearum TaxID=556287 RepID=UPI001FCDF086|nr:helix-turn-helix transcriptional regulator [Candidatus Liberibacter solanacearum]